MTVEEAEQSGGVLGGESLDPPSESREEENRAIHDFGDHPRRLHRVTLAGDLPYGVDGRTSKALVGDSGAYTPVAA